MLPIRMGPTRLARRFLVGSGRKMAASLTNLARKRTVKGQTIRCATFVCRVYVSIFLRSPCGKGIYLWEQGSPAMQATQFYQSDHVDAIAGKPCSHSARNDKGHPKVAFVAGTKKSAEAYFFISQPVSSARALPMSASERTVFTPASCSAANFSSAVPLPPEMIAPAWPMRLPGGAVTPAM